MTFGKPTAWLTTFIFLFIYLDAYGPPKITVASLLPMCLMLHLFLNSRTADQPLGHAQTTKSVSKVQRPLIEN